MQSRTTTDHLGKTYPTIRDMCRAWNITESQFDSRRSHGWTIKECLTIPRGARRNQGEITDHLGNKYPSYQAMCDAYHISDSTYQGRIKKGMSQKDALTMTKAEALNKHVHDHLGQEFPSKAAMCDHWGISRQIYFGRIGMGWSLKDTLETPIVEISANSKQVTDHEGNIFDSISDLCTYWKVGRTTYNQRIKAGWSMKDALTKPQQSKPIVRSEWTDHLGQKFESLNEMCRHWGVSRATFSSRIHKTGWSIERALTTKEALVNATIVTDYKGRKFPSMKDLCQFYGAPEYCLQGKHTDDFTKAYLYRFKPKSAIKDITVVKILEFPYFLTRENGKETVRTLEELLDIFHNSDDFQPFANVSIPEIHIVKCIEFPYYEVEYKEENTVWTYWQLIQYRKDRNYAVGKGKKGFKKNGQMAGVD